jgi:hypothetical protein
MLGLDNLFAIRQLMAFGDDVRAAQVIAVDGAHGTQGPVILRPAQHALAF